MDTNIETLFLSHLNRCGYFSKPSFDPQPVFEAARMFLGLDASFAEQNERLTTVINGLVRRGIIRFEYSRDPSLHPKDVLDYWHIHLTPEGAAELEGTKRR